MQLSSWKGENLNYIEEISFLLESDENEKRVQPL